MKRLIRRIWGWVEPFWLILSRPSVHFSLGFLTIGGFVAGIVFVKLFSRADYVATHAAHHWRPQRSGWR